MTTPPLAVNVRGKGRHYQHPVTGELVPSVTNIIGCLDKPALPRWAAKAVAEYADLTWDVLSQLSGPERIPLMKGAPWRESGKAADLGTAIHAEIEAYSGAEPEALGWWEPDVEPFMDQFVKFLEERKPTFIETEFTVFSRKYGYAGTADALMVMDDRFTLIDYKSGKGVYPEAALQLTALARADFILRVDGAEDPLPPADDLAVLHLRPGSWSLVPVVQSDGSWACFLGLLDVSAWVRDVASSSLGAPRKAMP